MTTYGPGIDQSQHAKSASHIIIINTDLQKWHKWSLRSYIGYTSSVWHNMFAFRLFSWVQISWFHTLLKISTHSVIDQTNEMGPVIVNEITRSGNVIPSHHLYRPWKRLVWKIIYVTKKFSSKWHLQLIWVSKTRKS